jgi:hypothetical protein
MTETFSGIRPVDAPGFIAVQLVGAGAAAFLSWDLVLRLSDESAIPTGLRPPWHTSRTTDKSEVLSVSLQ